jgi:hypothetical protein
MTKGVLYVTIGLVAISSIACAEDLSTARASLLPGRFTTSTHSDEWKIATVVDWPLDLKDGHTNGRVLRQEATVGLARHSWKTSARPHVCR